MYYHVLIHCPHKDWIDKNQNALPIQSTFAKQVGLLNNLCELQNDQLLLDLIMGQIEIPRKRSKKKNRKKGAKRDQFQLVPNNMTTTANKHKIVYYSTKHAHSSTHAYTQHAHKCRKQKSPKTNEDDHHWYYKVNMY